MKRKATFQVDGLNRVESGLDHPCPALLWGWTNFQLIIKTPSLISIVLTFQTLIIKRGRIFLDYLYVRFQTESRHPNNH